MAEVAIHRIARIKLVGSGTITLANEFPGLTFNSVDEYTVLVEPTFGSFVEVSKTTTAITVIASPSPPAGNNLIILTHKMG
jgi:hypothetical protein